MSSKNGYDLSRAFFNFTGENPEKIKPVHVAVFFFAVEWCNGLGWPDRFGLPTSVAMAKIGVKKYQTYINALNDLIEWEFLTLVSKAKNQYTANIIALNQKGKARGKAQASPLVKALVTQSTVHREEQGFDKVESEGSILKQETLNHTTSNHEQGTHTLGSPKVYNLKYFEEMGWIWPDGFSEKLKARYDVWLKYRQEVVGKPIMHPSVIEQQIIGFRQHNLTDDDACLIISGTIGKEAKNLIYDLKLPELKKWEEAGMPPSPTGLGSMAQKMLGNYAGGTFNTGQDTQTDSG